MSAAGVQEVLGRAAARLPRGRQPSDTARRSAVAVAHAVCEIAAASELHADRPLWMVEVLEDVHDLVERTGASVRDVRVALGLLTDAGVLDRIAGDGRVRLRLSEGVVGEAPLLARIAWDALRSAVRSVEASVMPTLAVTRALVQATAGLRADSSGEAVSCTQQELVNETLFGRTAVVAALQALVAIGAVEHGARRGTWTVCRLLPAVFGVVPFRRSEIDDPQRVPPAVASSDSTHGAVRTPASGVEPSVLPIVLRAPSGRASPPHVPPSAPARSSGPEDVGTGTVPGHQMMLEVGGVAVPLAPGMSLEPPPGARLTIEIDEFGRRFLRIDGTMRIGPLPT